MNPIFETENFSVRKLKLVDLEPFHEMQGNEKVMRFVRAKPMSFEEDQAELAKLVLSYDKPENDFWIYAVERNSDLSFVGTVALVRSEDHGKVNDTDQMIYNIKETHCEIGYRLLEKYWKQGYASEIVQGLIDFARKMGFKRLIACVADENIASHKIIERLGFHYVTSFTTEELGFPEKKYELYL